MTHLLVDIGNTRIKWAIASGEEIIDGTPLVHEQLAPSILFDAWKNLSTPSRMGVSCVSSVLLLELVESVATSLWPAIDIQVIESKADAFGVRNTYLCPEKLGVDRWLSMIAVRHQYALRACIVDCGTAITIDLLEANGLYQGGIISPGLTLMKSSLSQATELLQLDTQNHPLGFANSTVQGIYTGTLWSAIGLIEYVKRKSPENTTLILTGGDAQLIAKHIDCEFIVDSILVMRGLSIVLAGNK
jgi:type III pantothenate kinase